MPKTRGEEERHNFNLEYAVATTDTAFKQMFSISIGSDRDIVISMLNSFIPAFQDKPIVQIKEASTALPALKRSGEKQPFMDFHVISSAGVHYIVEMQARRHVMFDERALFYGNYARQLNEQHRKGEDCNLKPVIALQFLDYDSQRVRGIMGNVADSLVARVQANPIATDQYKKHYMFVDQCSGQSIQDLQLVQVELRRSRKDLFPPKSSFTISDWWLSVFRFSSSYNETVLDQCKEFMPSQILRALTRLRLDTWNDEQQAEYIAELIDRGTYETVMI